MESDLTVSQKILIACLQLEEQGHVPLTLEALIVQAWKNSPRTFGLKGFADEYPDSNRVSACIMGERGLVRRGWMIKVGQKLYTLSKQGKEEARRALTPDDPQPKRRTLQKIQLPKEIERRLEELFASVAYRRFKDGHKREIMYRDACRFWGLPEYINGEQLYDVLQHVPTTIKKVEDTMNNGQMELNNGLVISRKDIDDLVMINQYLLQQFDRHLKTQSGVASKRY